MKVKSLNELYIHELRDLHSCENEIIKALPKMAKEATSPELRSALEEHLQVTKRQAERLERIFQRLDESAKGVTCKGVKGIIDEGEDIIDMDAPEMVHDAALIAAAQRVEHYEIAAYGTARTYARRLGYDEDARLLQETLNEEGEADKKLTSIAETRVNIEATRTA